MPDRSPDGRHHGRPARPVLLDPALRPAGVHSTPHDLRPPPEDLEGNVEGPLDATWSRRWRVAIGVALPTLYAIGIVAAVLAATGLIDTGP